MTHHNQTKVLTTWFLTPHTPVRLGKGVVTDERGERRIDIVHLVEPMFPPPFQRFGHGDVEIRINALPRLDVDNHTP
jgi:hypothetical protein